MLIMARIAVSKRGEKKVFKSYELVEQVMLSDLPLKLNN